jgi:hypothetical protein
LNTSSNPQDITTTREQATATQAMDLTDEYPSQVDPLVNMEDEESQECSTSLDSWAGLLMALSAMVQVNQGVPYTVGPRETSATIYARFAEMAALLEVPLDTIEALGLREFVSGSPSMDVAHDNHANNGVNNESFGDFSMLP